MLIPPQEAETKGSKASPWAPQGGSELLPLDPGVFWSLVCTTAGWPSWLCATWDTSVFFPFTSQILSLSSVSQSLFITKISLSKTLSINPYYPRKADKCLCLRGTGRIHVRWELRYFTFVQYYSDLRNHVANVSTSILQMKSLRQNMVKRFSQKEDWNNRLFDYALVFSNIPC